MLKDRFTTGQNFNDSEAESAAIFMGLFEHGNIPSYNVGGPRSIAKLVNITPMSLWFMILIAIVNGIYKPTFTLLGGPMYVALRLEHDDRRIEAP